MSVTNVQCTRPNPILQLSPENRAKLQKTVIQYIFNVCVTNAIKNDTVLIDQSKTLRKRKIDELEAVIDGFSNLSGEVQQSLNAIEVAKKYNPLLVGTRDWKN